MTSSRRVTSRPRPRRSFTLVELIVAGVITAFVLGTVSASLANLAKAKHASRQRLEAHLRADAALEMIRRDVASIIRTDDLFFTRFLLIDNTFDTEAGRLDRDEMLLFSNHLRQVRSIEYNGEGTEFETQYRINEDDGPPTLWERSDPYPDKYPRGGGVATPVVDSVVALNIEAYDGFQWHADWDSDFDGMPYAVRVTVTASGDDGLDTVYTAPFATLRTVIAFDRILLPRDNLAALYAAEHGTDQEDENADQNADLTKPPSLDDLIDPATGLPRAGIRLGPGGAQIITDDGFSVIGNVDGAFNPTRAPIGGRPRVPTTANDPTQPVIIAPGSGTSATGSRGNRGNRGNSGNRGNNSGGGGS